MKNRLAIFLSFMFIVVMFLIAFLAIYTLPSDAQIVTHWGGNGDPNGWMNKWTGLLLLPVLATFLFALISVLPQNYSPLRRPINSTSADKKIFVAGMLFLMVASEVFIAIKAVGYI